MVSTVVGQRADVAALSLGDLVGVDDAGGVARARCRDGAVVRSGGSAPQPDDRSPVDDRHVRGPRGRLLSRSADSIATSRCDSIPGRIAVRVETRSQVALDPIDTRIETWAETRSQRATRCLPRHECASYGAPRRRTSTRLDDRAPTPWRQGSSFPTLTLHRPFPAPCPCRAHPRAREPAVRAAPAIPSRARTLSRELRRRCRRGAIGTWIAHGGTVPVSPQVSPRRRADGGSQGRDRAPPPSAPASECLHGWRVRARTCVVERA